MPSKNENVAVIGAGTMGHGIAYVVTQAGLECRMFDSNRAALEQARRRVEESYDKGVSKGKVDETSRDRGLALLTLSASLEEACAPSTLVIEAVPENQELKQRLAADVEKLVTEECMIASNTSSLSIGTIASVLRIPERFIGLHFFNPVAVMKLLEIVRGKATSEECVERSRVFAHRLGKTPIIVRDSPGFATSRLGVVLGLEAMRMLEAEVASAEDIDRAMVLGYNHPVGPLQLSDMIGLDVRLAIAEHLYATLGGDVYKPPRILRDMVAAGRLGRKSGHGFYEWRDGA